MEMELFPVDPLNPSLGYTLRLLEQGVVQSSLHVTMGNAYAIREAALLKAVKEGAR